MCLFLDGEHPSTQGRNSRIEADLAESRVYLLKNSTNTSYTTQPDLEVGEQGEAWMDCPWRSLTMT